MHLEVTLLQLFLQSYPPKFSIIMIGLLCWLENKSAYMVAQDFKPGTWESERWIYIWGQPDLQSKSKVSYTEKPVLNNNNKRTSVTQTVFGGVL